MCKKTEILYFILTVFIIGLTSCEKELNNTSSKQKSTEKTYEYAKLNNGIKLNEKEIIEITLHFEYEIQTGKALTIVKNFLQKENLNNYTQDTFIELSYNKKNDQFEELSTKIDEIGNPANNVSNQVITIDNIDWHVTIYKYTSGNGGPRTTVAVGTD